MSYDLTKAILQAFRNENTSIDMLGPSSVKSNSQRRGNQIQKYDTKIACRKYLTDRLMPKGQVIDVLVF